jgi:uncharacterized delta-60 repeat protein
VVADFGENEAAHGFSVATLVVDNDEKIVSVGYAGEGEDRDFAIAMFNSDGTPYTDFFTDGTTTLDIAGGADEAYDVVIQTIDNAPRILVVGKAWNGTTNDYDFALARYWQDPSDSQWKLDTTFDEDGVDDNDGDVFGVVLSDLGGLSPRDEATAVALQADGSIIVAGNIGMAADSFDFAVVRYDEDGRFDDDFGVVTAGFYGATESDWVRDVVIQSDGKIIVAGEIHDEQDPAVYHMAMARFHEDTVNGWELDSTFGPDNPDSASPAYDNHVVDAFLNTGKLVPEFAGAHQRGHGLALDANDNIVLVGQSSGDFAVLRFDANGDWATTFGDNGIATADLGGDDVPQGAIFRDDGTVNLPALPEGWCWVRVEQLLTEGSCNGISVKGSNVPPGVPALRLSAMSDSGFDYSDRRYIPISEQVAEALAIAEGDFFVARGNGSLHLVGRGTLAQPSAERVVFPDTMIRLRLSSVVRKFIALIWPSRLVRRQIEKRARTTAGIYKISQRDIDGFAVPLPPLSEQEEIVSVVEQRLSLAQESESQIEANLKRSSRLRQSILKRAFEGKLAPQDPNDEPATVLLGRIQAKHKGNAAPTNQRKQTKATTGPNPKKQSGVNL